MPIEYPKTVDAAANDFTKDTTTTHSAFGQISVARQSIGGSGINLYGSDFGHNSAIAIRISYSDLHRGLSYDRYNPRQEIIEVILSESQWATFVSSMNQGSGPCCTISHVNGEQKGRLPAPEDRSKQFSKEMRQTMDDAIKAIDDAVKGIKESGVSAKKLEPILSRMAKARQELVSNAPFVAGQFEEAMEDTIEKAKTEIHGYMNGAITRAGLESLQGPKDGNPLKILTME